MAAVMGKGGKDLPIEGGRAGIVGVRFHDPRHTCGPWLVEKGVPIGRIASVPGHSTVRMTERYAHLAPANSRAAVEKLVGVPNLIPSASAEEIVTA